MEEQTFGNRDVNQIVEAFAELYGTTKVTRYDRWAANRMAKSKHYGGAEGVVALMKLYSMVATDKYAPSVSSVAQFDDKLPAIVVYLKRKGEQSEVIQL